jgi:hypothetical protein
LLGLVVTKHLYFVNLIQCNTMLFESRSFVLFGIVVLSINAGASQGSLYHGLMVECDSWNSTVNSMQKQDSLNVTCHVNEPCSGFFCFGDFKVPGFSITERVNFGLEFFPCSSPLILQISLRTSGVPMFYKNLTLEKTGRNYNFSVPNASQDLGPLGKVSGNASVYMALSSADTRRVTLELYFMFHSESAGKTWPLVLVPRSEIIIPECIDNLSTTRPDTPTPTPTAMTGCSDVPMKSCTANAWGQCGNHQLCDSKALRCLCVIDYYWDGSNCIKSCIKPISTYNSQGNSSLIIALSCLGAALMLGALIAFVRYKYVRYHQRYGRHDLLVNNEADDDLADADPPMIEA